MRVYLDTLGCRLNEAELLRWTRELRRAGHLVVDRPEEAHAVVVNSCGVTADAARSTRRKLRSLHQKAPTARVAVTGCYATLEPELVGGIEGVDLLVDNSDKHQLVERLLALDPGEPLRDPDDSVFPRRRTRAFVGVQDGCRYRCAFCITTVARGAERSRPIDAVVAEVEQLLREGYREVVLTGVHLGGYGSDLEVGFTELVRAVLDRTEVERLRISSLEPWGLDAEFFALWRDPRLCPHLHLPLQSGSDAVLRRMARRCSADAFRRLVAAARAAIPDLHVSTDLIVGFPGETEAEHQATVELVAELGLGRSHVFAFSPREGTPAARMGDQIPGDIKRARSAELRALTEARLQGIAEGHVGTTRPVLWEAAEERTPEGVRWSGYTDTYLRCEALLPEGSQARGAIDDVQITAARPRAMLAGNRSTTHT